MHTCKPTRDVTILEICMCVLVAHSYKTTIAHCIENRSAGTQLKNRDNNAEPTSGLAWRHFRSCNHAGRHLHALRASTATAAQHQQYIECQHHCSSRLWVCNGATSAPTVDAIGRCVDDAGTAATTGDWHDGTRNCFCRSSCRGSLLANTICSVAAQSGNSCASE